MPNYDPNKVIVTLGPITLGPDFKKGTFIKVSYDVPAFVKYVGVDGSFVRVKSSDESGKIEVTVMKKSASNDLLSAMENDDRALGTGINAVQVKDASGTSLHHGDQAWLEKLPDTEYSTEEDSVTWNIIVGKLKSNVGSNA